MSIRQRSGVWIVTLTVSLTGCGGGPSDGNVPSRVQSAISAQPGTTNEQQKGEKSKPSANSALLEEVTVAGAWFRAKKVRPIWAKLVDTDQTVATLEGREQVKAGDFLCRGEIGEVWPQSADKLTSRYAATEEIDTEGWRKYMPHTNAAGVMAAQIDHAFTVHTERGDLKGKPGDYLLRNFTDRDVESPSDLWIVDQKLFDVTYGRVE